jgi:hypothetical protein
MHVMLIEICKLCLETKPLQKSHFIPNALYPKHRKPSYATRHSSGPLDSKDKQIKSHLLCFDCEQRFSSNGEAEVLHWINPKGKQFRLAERLALALPRECAPEDRDQSVLRFSGYDVGANMDKFAYFAISIVWRGAVCDWTMPDGTVRPHDALGGFLEPMRLYLLGQSPLPQDTSVIVIVGSDGESRTVWTTPQTDVDAGCLNFRFLTFGVMFRVMTGYRQPQYFRDYSCTSPLKCIFYGSMKHRMPDIMAIFDNAGRERN